MSNVYNVINDLNNSVAGFRSDVDVHVRNVDSSTQKILQTAESVYQRVSKFRTDIMHGEEKQIAHENIMRIDQVVKEQFGNYDAIRKTIMGVVRDFDINLVRNSTIEELSEELWITSSRYWLSYALIAVTAWVNNYPEVAKNALSEAVRKDEIKASLFFCLMNLRFERIQTAREWFKVYCRTLNPVILQQETAVLIQAFMGGVFGKDKQLDHEVISIINEWIRIISEDAAICSDLVGQYVAYFEKFNQQAVFSYEAIRTFCENSTEVERSFIDVSKYVPLIELVESLNVETSEALTEKDYKSRIDAVLVNLITNYDEEERQIREEQEYYRLVVENDGKKEVAEEQFKQIQALRSETFNIGKQMVDWAVYAEEDKSVRKFGLQSTKEWFITALENWTAAVRERCPLRFDLSIDGWRSTSSGDDLDSQRQSMQSYYSANKFKMIYINSINIALAIVFVLAMGVTVGSIFRHDDSSSASMVLIVGIVLAAASVGAFIVRVMSGKQKFAKRVAESMNNLEATLGQIAEFQRYFSENITKKDDVLEKLSYI